MEVDQVKGKKDKGKGKGDWGKDGDKGKKGKEKGKKGKEFAGKGPPPAAAAAFNGECGYCWISLLASRRAHRQQVRLLRCLSRATKHLRK